MASRNQGICGAREARVPECLIKLSRACARAESLGSRDDEGMGASQPRRMCDLAPQIASEPREGTPDGRFDSPPIDLARQFLMGRRRPPEGKKWVDFVEEPLCQAATMGVRGGGQPSKDGPLRLMWRRSALGVGSASPISVNSGLWLPIRTRPSPHSDRADAIGQVLGCA